MLNTIGDVFGNRRLRRDGYLFAYCFVLSKPIIDSVGRDDLPFSLKRADVQTLTLIIRGFIEIRIDKA